MTPGLVESLLAQPAHAFGGARFEVRVPWWPETLWLVPTRDDKTELARSRVGAHRVWTAAELGDVIAAVNPLTGDGGALTDALRAFGGAVVRVRLTPRLPHASAYDVESGIVALLQRGPDRTSTIHAALGRRRPGEVRAALTALLAAGRIVRQTWRTAGRPVTWWGLPGDFGDVA
jgi:hypothetical protein